MTPPLPDSERSRRIYPLLQNQDLENVSQATLKSVGDPISIENLNEDELRKLVLVNLARLSVKGEWNGLLTAASGGGITYLPNGLVDNPTTYKYWAIMQTAPFGISRTKTTSKVDGKGLFYPFIANQTGSMTAMQIRVRTAHSGGVFYGAIYSADEDTSLPKTLQGYCEFNVSSTGVVSQTSFSSTVTTTRGSMYYLYYNTDNATTATNLVFDGINLSTSAVSATGGPFDGPPTNTSNAVGAGFRYNAATYGVPATTVDTEDLEYNAPFGGGNTGDPVNLVVSWT